MAYVAIDPGGKTGVAVTPSLDYRVMRKRFKVYEVPCNVADPYNGVRKVLEILHDADSVAPGLVTVLMEDFILQEFTMTRDLLSPVRVASMVEYAVRDTFPSTKFIYRMPNQRKICTPDRMRRWKLWTPGMKDANAAMQHLASYAREHA